MKNLIRFLSIFMILLTCCQQNLEKREKDVFIKAIEQLKIDGKYQWIVVLPGLGCHGCIQEGEYFMQNNIEDQRILFVLTKVSSLKILQQKTEVRIDEHANIYVDREDLFNIPTNNAIYPCVIQMKKRKFISHSFQNSANKAIRKLREQL